MNIEEFRDYCLAKPAVSECFPFDETTLVFKVMGKMFALTDTEDDFKLALKCDPQKAQALREQYPAVQPGYHMNKVHWNTIVVDGSVADAELYQWIDDSYALIVERLPYALRQELQAKADSRDT
ncbi:MAG: MmcQ/YjbR family DNA-binding protein [Bacteroidales bacterium]|nr:MmcQ/YjbR family DNA-binding protein [Bacteroidales bacterium]MDD3010643.1 MmcQ/YjbR family DNA-binding protein [Bacteroidales bacterium]MDD3960913.1 MmcQ/YjbR family DNA-binding protein [Bacteroidales bacterium]HPE85715.1 MmcQ/YjbR family DNA-binding protein [Bacteroidales bacterium]